LSWSKVKTLLIILFVFVNGFLLYNTVKIGGSSEISQTTVNNTVKILNRNNVKIDTSIIRKKPEKLKKAEISNSIDSRSKLATSLLGNCTETAEGYVSAKGKIRFSSVAFYYENYEKINAKKINEGNAVDVAAEFLREKNFEVETSWVQDFSNARNGYVVKFGKKINGFWIYESYIEVKIGENGVLQSIEGYWPEVILDKNSSTEIVCVSETTVLINLLSSEGFDTSVENEVVDIQTGYTLGGSPESEKPILLTVLPAYRVILKNGENYIFDCETGGFLYKY